MTTQGKLINIDLWLARDLEKGAYSVHAKEPTLDDGRWTSDHSGMDLSPEHRVQSGIVPGGCRRVRMQRVD